MHKVVLLRHGESTWNMENPSKQSVKANRP